MKTILIGSILAMVTLCGTSNLSAATTLEVNKFNRSAELGNKSMRSKNYDKAAKHLKIAAKLGDKISQYSLAVLYLEGLGVKQDYSKAYLWLNVASEAKETKWRGLRDKLKAAMSEQQIAALQPHVDDYIKQFGEEAQDVSCSRKAATGSNRKMMICTKQLNRELVGM